MSTPHGLFLALVLCLPSPVFAQQAGVQAEPDAGGGSSAPALNVPPITSHPPVEPEGLIHLDVVVTDGAGKPVSGMDRGDFTLFDNGQSEKIVSFHAFGETNSRPNPPAAVILLIDTRGVPKGTAIDERRGIERFLRQNSGRLAEPVTIYTLDNTGSWLETGPSLDGNVMAAAVEHGDKLAPLRVTPMSFQEGEAPAQLRKHFLDRPYLRQSPLAVLPEIGYILTAERQKSGRKLLLWVGPGVIGSGAYPEPTNPADRQDIFDKVYWFSTLLREARVTLSTFSVGDNKAGISSQPGYWGLRDPWEKSLNGVKSVDQATAMDLYKKVLAVESGGRAPLSENDLEKQMDACLQEAGTFYTLTFDPPLALHAAEYHNLKVEVHEPGLTARTMTGYYDEPFYDDAANPEIKRVTAAELEQIAGSARGESDGEVARQLSELELTERLSGATLTSLTEHSRTTVLYRQGAEVMDADAGKRAQQNRGLSTNGTFGPLLRVVRGAMELSGAVTWSRWEQDAGGRRAVFRYRVPAEQSLYAVGGCCLPGGDGSSDFAIRPGYHGELAIDPASGAILRVEVQADLTGFVPLKQSDITVSYAPVTIGGKMYILPARSVHIWRKRTVPVLEEWNAGFNTWGPYKTMLNQFTFEDYHMFRGESRMLGAFQ